MRTLLVMDRYVAKPTIKMFLNTVSPENAFIIGETVVLGTDSGHLRDTGAEHRRYDCHVLD